MADNRENDEMGFHFNFYGNWNKTCSKLEDDNNKGKKENNIKKIAQICRRTRMRMGKHESMVLLEMKGGWQMMGGVY